MRSAHATHPLRVRKQTGVGPCNVEVIALDRNLGKQRLDAGAPRMTARLVSELDADEKLSRCQRSDGNIVLLDAESGKRDVVPFGADQD